ncbi:MAG: hypothetical protein GXP55_12185 [Deltaproteobacteria bacterium]|nr:hypothetical protein [Deltaproteobacteria bacterium]
MAFRASYPPVVVSGALALLCSCTAAPPRRRVGDETNTGTVADDAGSGIRLMPDAGVENRDSGARLEPGSRDAGVSPGADAGAGAGSGTGTGAVDAGAGTGGSGTGTGGGSGGSAGTSYCAACTSDADCGGGNNFCLGYSFGNYCGTDCGSGQACPTNTRCAQITDSAGSAVGMNCAPLAGDTCAGSGGSGSGGSGSGGSGSGAACTTDTYSGWPSTFFTGHCRGSGCHTSEFGRSDVSARASLIASYISSGSMPRGERLSSADRTRILTYLNCGAP